MFYADNEFGHILASLHYNLLIKKDRESIISFVKGYLATYPKRDSFLKKMGNYLYHTYGIDDQYNSWVWQVEHYLYLKQQDWFEGLCSLVREQVYFDFTQLPARQRPTLTIVPEEFVGEEVNRVTIGDFSLQVGQYLQLTDKIGEAYRQTKFFDLEIPNPSWELLYPSALDFQYVSLFHQSEKPAVENEVLPPATLGKVWRILSGTMDQVQSIWRDGDQYIVYTNIFRVELNAALSADEVTLGEVETRRSVDQDMIDYYQEAVENVRLGLIVEYEDLTDIFQLWFHLGQGMFPWVRYMPAVTGKWYPLSTSKESSKS